MSSQQWGYRREADNPNMGIGIFFKTVRSQDPKRVILTAKPCCAPVLLRRFMRSPVKPYSATMSQAESVTTPSICSQVIPILDCVDININDYIK